MRKIPKLTKISISSYYNNGHNSVFSGLNTSYGLNQFTFSFFVRETFSFLIKTLLLPLFCTLSSLLKISFALWGSSANITKRRFWVWDFSSHKGLLKESKDMWQIARSSSVGVVMYPLLMFTERVIRWLIC